MSTVTDTRDKTIFDINVWNRGAYYSEDKPIEEHYNEWMLCPYALNWDGTNWSIAEELDELNLLLTEEEVFSLTLGWGTDLGGDYIDADDFWIDVNSFKDTYKDIPPRVSEWIDKVLASL